MLAGAGVAAAVLYALPDSFAWRIPLIGVLLVAAPAAAVAASIGAFRAVPSAVGRPWLVFAAAAAVAALARFSGFVMQAETSAITHVLINVVAMSLFAFGVAWILHQRDRERMLEIGLDAGLVLAAVTLVTLRWSPAARHVLDHPELYTPAQEIGLLGAPIATGCAFLFASVLLLVRGGSRAGHTAAAIAGASVAFGVAAAPLATGAPCCDAAHPVGLAYIVGWLALSYAGVRATRMGTRGFQPVGMDAGGSRVRLVVAPAVAVVMGAVVVDASWRGPLQEATAVMVGVLGLLLALRVSQLLFATRTQSAERVQLVQSRALIEVSRALSGTRELDETLELVTKWAVELLDARAAAIELLSADGQALEVRAVRGLPTRILRLKFTLDDSFSGWVVTHGKARATADSGKDRLVRASSARFLGNAPMAAAPLRYRDTTLGAISCIGRYPFTAADLELLGAFADQAAVAIENARLFRQVKQLSLTDPLTGLANRRQLTRDLAREFAAAGRGRQLVVVMFDMNGFKEYNDRYGHLAGDDALKLFGGALLDETRAMNMAARYGGDEFIVLLTDTDAIGAEIFIDRVRTRFPGKDANEQQRRLSVAAGWALYNPDMHEPEELIDAADRALYADKSSRYA
jgi:diguanylate cyclase (GGDEF)-like protein